MAYKFQHTPKFVFRDTIQPYIPAPLQCHQCFWFGYTQKNVATTAPSLRCVVKKTYSRSCPQMVGHRCSNCGLGHPANSKNCPKYEHTKKALHLIATSNIEMSLQDALTKTAPAGTRAAAENQTADTIEKILNSCSLPKCRQQ